MRYISNVIQFMSAWLISKGLTRTNLSARWHWLACCYKTQESQRNYLHWRHFDVTQLFKDDLKNLSRFFKHVRDMLQWLMWVSSRLIITYMQNEKYQLQHGDNSLLNVWIGVLLKSCDETRLKTAFVSLPLGWLWSWTQVIKTFDEFNTRLKQRTKWAAS